MNCPLSNADFRKKLDELKEVNLELDYDFIRVGEAMKDPKLKNKFSDEELELFKLGEEPNGYT
ncbi:hypothetical protein ACIQ57_17010 [Lysinibacillus xylanilyticus]|uniref:hypothetical protein n=1 Tax=Lysinibacillus xylanilyticus TaxID=582475 RepID=UPI0038202CEF